MSNDGYNSYLDPEEADYAAGMSEWLGYAKDDPANAGMSYADWVTQEESKPAERSLWQEALSHHINNKPGMALSESESWRADTEQLMTKLSQESGISRASLEGAFDAWNEAHHYPADARLEKSARRVESGFDPITPQERSAIVALDQTKRIYHAEYPPAGDLEVTVDGVTTNLFEFGYASGFEDFAAKYEAAHSVEETIGGIAVTRIDAALRENHAVHWEYVANYDTVGISDDLYDRAQASSRELQGVQATLIKSLGQKQAGEALGARVNELWPTWTRDQVANEMREGFATWELPTCQEMTTADVEYMQQRTQDQGMSL